MKYQIYAKFLGSYMPEKRAKIGDCIILKSHDQYHIDDDRPEIPVRTKNSEFHCLERGVKNYIYYPQQPISVRTFESEYLITTEVITNSEHDALETAGERFLDVASVLALVAKNKTVKLGSRRIKRGDEKYDFEIIGMFIKRGKNLIRLKLPKPLINGRNFFPKNFPKNFLLQARKFIASRDPVFKKGLIYFQRATAMRHSGVFSDLEITLNFVKCIELVCWDIGEDDNFGLSKKKFKDLETKKTIEFAGKKMRVAATTIKEAKTAWDIRNKGDIAHKDLYFNPYSRRSTHALINFDVLERSATQFLTKYFQYRQKNPSSYL